MYGRVRQVPEAVEVVRLEVWQGEEGAPVPPVALQHHLDDVDDAQRGDQPALVSTHVQQGLHTHHTIPHSVRGCVQGMRMEVPNFLFVSCYFSIFCYLHLDIMSHWV